MPGLPDRRIRSNNGVPMKCRILALLLLLLLAPASFADEKVFLEAMKYVQRGLYDREMRGVDWPATQDELLPRAKDANSPAETSAIINEAIARLGVSHTRHFISSQREYYELLDVFFPSSIPGQLEKFGLESGPVHYTGVGIVAKDVGGKMFAADVYDGGPAAKAGILTGDELIAIDGNPWGDITPFEGKEDQPVTITIRRDKLGETRDIEVRPASIQPRIMYLRSMRAGAKQIARDGRTIAYVRIRSYASESYQDLLTTMLAGRFAKCDGLVLDLRGGWGGAQAKYMNLFGSLEPDVEFKGRSGEWAEKTASPTWNKPIVVLIDSGTRSGKEILSHAFKTRHRATLVGTRTAGAVLGGSPKILSDGSLLLIAVSDVRVDGKTLEGVGVEPDVIVERQIPYAAGKDAQFERGVDVLFEQLSNEKPPVKSIR